MAIVRTGPRGHQLRQRDIGPAAAGAVDGIGAMGRISALGVRGGSRLIEDGEAQPGGAGPIERRQLTPAELAARTSRDLVRRLDLALRPAGVVAEPTRAPATTTQPPEEDRMTTTAQPAIPCGDCLHEPVCALKERLPVRWEKIQPQTSEELGDGLRIRRTLVIECDHHLTSVGSSTSSRAVAIAAPSDAERAQASRMRGAAATAKIHAERRAEPEGGRRGSPMTATDDEIIAALAAHGGNRAGAARALDMSRVTLQRRIERLQERNALPDEVAGMLSSKPGYRGAAVPA